MEVVFRQRIRWLYATNFDYQNQKGFTRTEAEILNAYDERSHMDPSKRTRLFMFLFRIFFAPFFLVAWVGWVSNLFNFNRSFASFASLCGKFFFRESPRRSFFFLPFLALQEHRRTLRRTEISAPRFVCAAQQAGDWIISITAKERFFEWWTVWVPSFEHEHLLHLSRRLITTKLSRTSKPLVWWKHLHLYGVNRCSTLPMKMQLEIGRLKVWWRRQIRKRWTSVRKLPLVIGRWGLWTYTFHAVDMFVGR